MAVSKKWLSLGFLVLIQILSGLIYKLAQTSSDYAFSPFAALAIAEALKLAISAVMFALQCRSSNSPKTAFGDEVCKLDWRAILKIQALALLYCINNRITFVVMKSADPASYVVFKSMSSVFTALTWRALMGTPIKGRQWAAIVQQSCGLIATQYDSCTGSMILPAVTYALLSASTVISSLTAVVNEKQLKRMPIPMHLQNAVLYSGGMLFNGAGHWLASQTQRGTPRFFEGFNAASAVLIVMNACIGIVCVAVYKFADAVIKSLAFGVTTVVLTLISSAMFDLKLNPINVSGCVVIAASVYQYTIGHGQAVEDAPPSRRRLEKGLPK